MINFNIYVNNLKQLQIGGCYFHWLRALDHNIEAKGLGYLKRKSTLFSHFLKLLKAIPFVPPHAVEDALLDVLGWLDQRRNVRKFDQL